MPPQKHLTPITATRITYQTAHPFSTVEARLTASIRPGGSSAPPSTAWPAIIRSLPSPPTAADRAAFTSAVDAALGPHGFMEFVTLDHGAWLPIYAPATATSRAVVDGEGKGKALQIKRFVLGNPLIAITMLEWDVHAGLFAPVEVLLVEDERGEGCRVVYMLPSGVVAGYEGAGTELVAAARRLDEKLEALVRDVTRD